MAGWLHGVFVVDWLFVFPLCGFSLSLFCNYCNQHRSGAACDNAGARRSDPWQGIGIVATHTFLLTWQAHGENWCSTVTLALYVGI